MMMKEEDIKILEQMKTNKGWANQTLYGYKTAVMSCTDFNKKSLTELINEADEEENSGIRWKDRSLKTRLINFRTHLYEKYLVRTAKEYLKRIIIIYGDLEIEVHRLPKFTDKDANHPDPIYFEDLPTQYIIWRVCEISDPLMTAVLLFMSSSGSGKKETLNLTIKDFIQANRKIP
jgi:hypothetical protein